MALEVDYIPWAAAAGANVYTPAEYAANPAVNTGVEPGIADPQLANNTWRLSSMMSAALANFISATLQINVLDDGNLPNLITDLTEAIAIASIAVPTTPVTAAGAFTIASNEKTFMFARVAPGEPSTAVTPANPADGEEHWFEDISANFATSGFSIQPVVITAGAGQSFAGGLPTATFNIDGQCGRIKYCAEKQTWSVKS